MLLTKTVRNSLINIVNAFIADAYAHMGEQYQTVDLREAIHPHIYWDLLRLKMFLQAETGLIKVAQIKNLYLPTQNANQGINENLND